MLLTIYHRNSYFILVCTLLVVCSMLQKGCLFHRAKKVERKVQFDKNAKGNIEKEKAALETEKRVRLSMHSDELFVDGEEVSCVIQKKTCDTVVYLPHTFMVRDVNLIAVLRVDL